MVGETKLSESYIRTQIRILEESGRVEKVDQRQPYIYRVPANHPSILHKELVKEYKAQLIDPKRETKSQIIIGARTLPKGELPKLADSLEAIAEAIRQLDTEGKLIDTL
jgi:hypothetical protein